jgi:carboxymethylenebutenolidase
MTTPSQTAVRFPEPVSASAARTVIHTSATGLAAERITIPIDGHDVPVYTARPAGGADLPVVLVLSETFGLHPYIEDVTRRFARQGYLAVAPDLMSRQGDPASYPDVDRLVKDLLQHIPDAQVLADLDGVLAWAAGHGGDPDRVGVSGFSWGARWAWLFAAHARVSAVVSWYGVLDDTSSGLYPSKELFPRHPIDLIGDLRTPVLGLYAEKDAVIPVSTVDTMKAGLASRPAGAPEVEFVVYPEAVHGFFADYRDDYHAASAVDGWDRTLAWLRKHGV